MIQLKVYDDYVTPWTSADGYFLDLYETQPIKLNLSIEDITNADATSAFSRTFRVPATRNNNNFFENAWDIKGILFDVTIKKPAQILVNGSEFRTGHVRLQKVFTNEDQDKIDYELLFLGETRDFSSLIGEKRMCELTLTDFSWTDLPQNYTNAADFTGPFSYSDVVTSWQAFPQQASTTAGYADGDLLFPLINHGNTYDNGDPEQGAILLGSTGSGVRSFTHSANDLAIDRLKPMIRAKRLWDQIFEDSGYTYSSTFLNSDRFKQMYVSAFGNSASISVDTDQITDTIFSAQDAFFGDNGANLQAYLPNVTANNGGSFNIGTPDGQPGGSGSWFVAPGTASVGGSYYLMDASAELDFAREESDGGYVPIAGALYLEVWDALGGNVLHTLAVGTFVTNGNTSSLYYDSRAGGYQPQQGDIIQLTPRSVNATDIDQVENMEWNCTAAPGNYYPLRDLDCEYNQIDFIKDVITMFRLVMQPDKDRPNNFIIEPWQDFIGSGEIYDWSDKLIREKDFISEPLFNTQSAVIEFSKEEDEDFINKFHQDQTKHAYGWLRFDSQNELLKGSREVKVEGISPTPIDQIQHGASGTHPEPSWILPTIVEVDSEQTAANPSFPQNLAIKPNTRFLFYNGLQDIQDSSNYWYLNDNGTPTQQDDWPLVSPYEDWPITNTSLNLNFYNDVRYFLDPSPGSTYFTNGVTLYDEYWSRYINSLYNKFSRRVTAYFTLNNVDLQDLTFDDLIFIDGAYYRPEKIIDAQIGSRTAVKVQLITYKDERPVWLDEPLTGFSVVVSDGPCYGDLGSVQVTTNGTPNFTWELTELGITGSHSAQPGQAPYIFDIDNVPLGTHTLLVTDALGRTAQVSVTVNQSTATEVTATWVETPATDCTAPCNGAVTVTPAGGSGTGYTVTWNDGATGATRTNLCPGTYLFYVNDSNGCQSDIYEILIECTVTQNSFIVREYLNNCTASGAIDYYADYPGQLSQGDVVTLDNRPGCYFVFGSTQIAPQYNIVNTYVDCTACEAAELPQQSWKVADCDTGTDIRYVNDDWNLVPGQAITIQEPGNTTCYEVIEGSTTAEDWDVDTIFNDCDSCQDASGGYAYYGVFCDGSAPPVYFASNIQLTLNTVYTVLNGPYAGKCVTIVIENPGATTFGDLDTSTAYDTCEECEGTSPVATCHTIVAGASGASGTYTRGGNTFNFVLGANVTAGRCGDPSSFTVTSGSATINDTGNPCATDADCAVRNRSFCHEITGGTSANYTQFDWIDGQGFPQSLKVPALKSTKICAVQGSVIQRGPGNGTFTIDLAAPCFFDNDCY